MNWNHLEIREIFHLEFLRRLIRAVSPSNIALKGGSNLRFFFRSIRYSEDMDMDVKEIPVHIFRDKVMDILNTKALTTNLKTFGIEEVVPPDISKAKQTETVQRFKVHLIMASGEDLFTKLEFSRRGFDPFIKAEGVNAAIMNWYQLPPLIIPHYLIDSVLKQKINALMHRKEIQARDIFDLYTLSTQLDRTSSKMKKFLRKGSVEDISERIDWIHYQIYRDTVVSYLDMEEQETYDSPQFWDEIRLQVLHLIEKWI
jgi:predicted nucleotidyltransferase component of viral defense system